MSLPSNVQSYLENQYELQQELGKTNIGELLAAKKIIDSEANRECMEDLRDQDFINDKKALVAEVV